MTTFRPLFWPTVFSLPALMICLALGAWQVERLFWKQDLIAQREAAVTAAPAAVPKTLSEARSMEFRHVSDEGVFLNDKEIYLGATSEGGGQGYQVLTPLLEPGGRVVFVNRGYIPAELRDPAKRAARPDRRHNSRARVAAAAAGREAELVSARQPPRSKLLVLGRPSGNERGGQTRPGRTILH